MDYINKEIKNSCKNISNLISKYSKGEDANTCLCSFFELFENTLSNFSKNEKEETTYLENIKNEFGLKQNDKDKKESFFKLFESEKINKKDFLEFEDNLLILVDEYLDKDESRKEFETAKNIQIIKSKIIGPIIDSNSMLLVEMGLAKNEEEAKTKINKGLATNYFLSLER